MALRRLAPLVLVLALGCAPGDEAAERAREDLRTALDSGDRGAALLALEDLRESLPDTPEAAVEIASSMVAVAEGAGAVWFLQDALERFPEDDNVRIALAQAALLTNDPSLAHLALEPIGPDSRHHVEALLVRARAQLDLGDLEGALELMRETERLYPERPEARFAQITTLISEQRFDAARELVEEAKRAAHSDTQRRQFDLLTAHIQIQQGAPQEAIDTLRPLAEGDPSDVRVWSALNQLYLRTARGAEARELLRAVLDARPDQVHLQALLAQVYAVEGELELAERSLRVFAERAESPTGYSLLAQLHAQAGNVEGVLGALDEGLKRFPDSRPLRLMAAEALIGAGKLEEARAAVGRYGALVREDDPRLDLLEGRLELASGEIEAAHARLERVAPELDTAAAQYLLGLALERRGDLAGARRRYRLALHRDPMHREAYLGLLRIVEQNQNWVALAQVGSEFARYAPRDPRGYQAIVRALVALGMDERAGAAAREAAERLPDRVETQIELARALRAGGQHERALETLDRALERHGRSIELEAEHALSLGLAGRVEEALAELDRAIERAPDAAQLHAAVAALAFQQGDAERGSHAVERALELSPDDPRPLKLRASFTASQGQLGHARVDLERYLAERPSDAEAHFTLGVIRAADGDSDAAIQSYRRAVELDERQFAARNNLAVALADRGELAEALRVAQEAYQLASSDPYVIDTLGWLYLKEGLVERSVSLLEEAHRTAPDLLDAKFHLALAYREDSRPEEARRLLEEVRAATPAGHQFHARAGEVLRALE